MMSILEEIFLHKRRELEHQKELKPLEALQREAEAAAPPLDFLEALKKAPGDGPALIAEIKFRSPSRGLLNEEFDPLHLARLYRQNGAAAISVLTDERYFGGSLEALTAVVRDREEDYGPALPVLRKDFICDPYQIYQARATGADAVLLIAAALPEELPDLHSLAIELGMTPLVEVHNQEELERALKVNPVLIGINNRNLHDFSVDLNTTIRLKPQVPAGIPVIAESGICTWEDVNRMAEAGLDGILVGEALVTAPDPAQQVRLFGGVA